jgi:hypothetical protein
MANHSPITMNTSALISYSVIALLGLSASVSWAKDSKESAIERFDGNNNFYIEGKEVAALKKAYQEEKQSALQVYDSDRDGTLSDKEIAAIRIHKPTPEPKKIPNAGKKPRKFIGNKNNNNNNKKK